MNKTVVLAAALLFILCGCDPHREGRKLLAEGKYEKAAKYFLDKTKENPQDYRAFHELGYCYTKLDLLIRAASAYEQAIKLKPDHFPSYLNLGIVHMKRGYIDGSYNNLKKAIELQPDNAEAHYAMAWTAASAWRIDEAIEHGTKAKALSNGKIGTADLERHIGFKSKERERIMASQGNAPKPGATEPGSNQAGSPATAPGATAGPPKEEPAESPPDSNAPPESLPPSPPPIGPGAPEHASGGTAAPAPAPQP